jgi:putative oxidoreductase
MPSFDSPPALVALRIICGFFFLPHIIGKFTSREAASGFFHAAGFRPAMRFLYLAMVIEVTLATLLMTGFYVHTVALIAAIYLFIAAASVIKVEKKWLWHIGGCEYPLFWGLCCLIVARYA